MSITADTFNEYVNTRQYDLAKESLDTLRSEGNDFKSFTSINTVICLIKLALNTPSLSIPSGMLAGYYLAPKFNQLLTCLPMESKKHLAAAGESQEAMNRVSHVCIDILKAASETCPESLRVPTFHKFVEQLLLHRKFPRHVGMKGEAFEPHRDLYFGADLGL